MPLFILTRVSKAEFFHQFMGGNIAPENDGNHVLGLPQFEGISKGGYATFGSVAPTPNSIIEENGKFGDLETRMCRNARMTNERPCGSFNDRKRNEKLLFGASAPQFAVEFRVRGREFNSPLWLWLKIPDHVQLCP